MKTITLLTLALVAETLVACREPPADPAPPAPPIDPGVSVARVSWPATDRIDRAALSRLPAAASAKVAHATVPVMVPTSASILANGTVIAEPVFYAFSASEDGLNVSIQGTRGEYRAGDVAPFERADTVRGAPAVVSETDAIWTAAWVENGAAYALSVECARAEDARCKDKRYILELADGLAYVGGEGAVAR